MSPHCYEHGQALRTPNECLLEVCMHLQAPVTLMSFTWTCSLSLHISSPCAAFKLRLQALFPWLGYDCSWLSVRPWICFITWTASPCSGPVLHRY